MSKKHRKQYRNKVTTVVPNVEIELSTGAVVRCMPILASIEAVRQTVEQPEKPAYEMKDAGGSVMNIPYDQAAIDDPTTPAEDKALWAKYLADSAAASRQANTRIYNRIIRRGIKIIKGGIGSGGLSKAAFTAELKEDEIEVPKNKTAFHRLYVRLEIIATPDDFEAIMLGIGIASGADEERIKAAEMKLFRAVEEGQESNDTSGTDSGDTSTGQKATK